METWTETQLWNRLRAGGEDTERLREGIGPILRDAEAVLQSGGTQPATFTLHDADHAFRVAERMVELTPGSTLDALSGYELALLLGSAYLHDIGMAPPGAQLSNLRRFILGEGGVELEPDVMQSLLAWMDGHVAPEAVPVPPEIPHRVEVAEALVAGFVRDSHNDWSQRWIEEHASSALGNYTAWRDDLVCLCRSHHQGYRELASDTFSGRLVAGSASRVNLRYLAVVLRMADVLEVDPERTPLVVQRHRLIDPDSVRFWEKDRQMSVSVGDHKLLVHARPTSALLQRSVIETVDAIDSELALCRQLKLDGALDRMPGGPCSEYVWPYDGSVDRDIREGGSFRYIDGAFRPDTERLLQLLGGIELYSDRLLAVRELLQNAFDAVREEIAWTRISRPGAFAAAAEVANLAATHRVDLELETVGQPARLTCRDSGVGMSERILRERLLVSGTSQRPDTARLERLARAQGFEVGRTGRFGIGVLSYFMLAERVTLRSRRSATPGDAETGAWIFESQGVGSFGELRPLDGAPAGTEVVLALDPGRVDDVKDRLVTFLHGWLTEVPCRFVATIDGETVIDTGPGFAFLPRQPPTRSREVSWKVEEGELPDGIGSYRIDVPTWTVDGETTLVDISAHREADTLLTDGEAEFVSPDVIASWRGMRVGLRDQVWRLYGVPHGLDDSAVLTAMGVANFTSDAAGVLGVDREHIAPTKSAEAAIDFVRDRIRAVQHEVARSSEESEWALLNHRVAGILPAPSASWNWLAEPVTDELSEWRPIRFPVVLLSADNRRPLGHSFRGSRVSVVPPISYGRSRSSRSAFPWRPEDLAPDLVASLDGRPVGVILAPPNADGPARGPDSAKFPPEWRRVAGVAVDGAGTAGAEVIAFNRENRLVELSYLDGRWADEAQALRFNRDRRRDVADGETFRKVAGEDPRLLASWILLGVVGESYSPRTLAARDLDWWRRVWSTLGLRDPVLFWVDRGAERGLHVLDANTWQYRDAFRLSAADVGLPEPHIDWRVTAI